jgi:hypothetical protein
VVAEGGNLIFVRAAGDYEAIMSWSVENLGRHPDLSFSRQLAFAVRRQARYPPSPPPTGIASKPDATS